MIINQMKKPKVATLSAEEREELIQHVKESSLTGDEQQTIIVPYNFCKDGIRIEKSFCLGGINNVDISCVMAVVD